MFCSCVQVFDEGVSNRLVGCCLHGNQERSDIVLVRVYGYRTELCGDREYELVAMVMVHRAGCGAPLYAKFKNGIAYGYVQGQPVNSQMVKDETISR